MALLLAGGAAGSSTRAKDSSTRRRFSRVVFGLIADVDGVGSTRECMKAVQSDVARVRFTHI